MRTPERRNRSVRAKDVNWLPWSVFMISGGPDRFRLAVSADGSSFFDGLSIDNATGIVDQPQLPRFKAYMNYDNYVGVGTWTKIGLNNAEYDLPPAKSLTLM